MRPRLVLDLVTPGGVETLEGDLRLRLDAPDGSRGIWPGHERARVVVEAGPIEVTDGEATRYVATEGGLAWIERTRVTLVTPWAAVADDLDGLKDRVIERGKFRLEAEAEARAVAVRHEMATRRALAGLRREVET